MENDQNKTPTASGLPDENAPPVDLMSDSSTEGSGSEPKDNEPTLAPGRAPSDRLVINPVTPGLALPNKQPLSDLSTANAIAPDIGGRKIISATDTPVTATISQPGLNTQVIGSQIAPEKAKPSIGIYLIALFGLIVIGISFLALLK